MTLAFLDIVWKTPLIHFFLSRHGHYTRNLTGTGEECWSLFTLLSLQPTAIYKKASDSTQTGSIPCSISPPIPKIPPFGFDFTLHSIFNSFSLFLFPPARCKLCPGTLILVCRNQLEKGVTAETSLNPTFAVLNAHQLS